MEGRGRPVDALLAMASARIGRSGGAAVPRSCSLPLAFSADHITPLVIPLSRAVEAEHFGPYRLRHNRGQERAASFGASGRSLTSAMQRPLIGARRR